MQKLADPGYGKYEGNQTASAHQFEGSQAASARQHYETSYEQDLGEGPSGKVYPLLRDKTNLLCFALAVIALVLILLFGLLFGVVIGGWTGAVDFAFACLALLVIAGVGIIAIKTR